VELALGQLRATREDNLLELREVGRKRLPSNLIGLLFMLPSIPSAIRGQLLVTARMIAPVDRYGVYTKYCEAFSGKTGYFYKNAQATPAADRAFCLFKFIHLGDG